MTDASARQRNAQRRVRLWTAAWLALVLGAFLLASLDKLHEGDELVPLDTAGYLTQARDLRENGGPLPFLAQCYRGEYAEANQMPLYVVILSQLPFGSMMVLAGAKLLTVLIGAAGVAVLFFVARRLYGLHAAMLASALLAMNTSYILHSTLVTCEPLLAIWVTLAWYFLVRYLRGEGGGMWAGLMIGLAYMTKGSGLFLVPVALGAVVYKERWRALRSKDLWLGAALFLVIASPILVRNVRRFGSPFYNVNSHVAWMDSWDEYYSPDPAVSRPTASSYWRTHSAAQAATRFTSGARQQAVFLTVMSGQTYLLNERLHLKAWPVGLLALLLMAAACLTRAGRKEAWPAVATLGVFLLFFAWYPVKDMRFLVPTAPIICALAAVGVQWVLERAQAIRPRIAPARVVMVVAIVLAAGTALAALPRPNVRKDPSDCYTTPPGYMELFVWLRSSLHPSDTVYMLGPSNAYSYFWSRQMHLGGVRMDIPWVKSIAEMNDYIRAHKVKYVVVDYGAFEQRRRFFSAWMDLDGKTLRLREPPAGWQPVFPTATTAAPYWVFDVAAP